VSIQRPGCNNRQQCLICDGVPGALAFAPGSLHFD
jgi:hypothetical protein